MDFLHCSSICCTPAKAQAQLEHVLSLYRRAFDDMACYSPGSDIYIYHKGLVDAYYHVLSLMAHPVPDDDLYQGGFFVE